MTQVACPACASSKTQTIERVSVAELTKLYAEDFGIDVSKYFSSLTEIGFEECSECNLRFFYPAVVGDDSFYERLQRFDWYYQDDKPEYAFARNYVASDAGVLEIGCGKGAFCALLPKSVRYTGLEFNTRAVTTARSAGLNVLKQSVSAHAASSFAQYDVVCSFQVLEHVTEVSEFVQSCVSLLKPNGTLLLGVPAEDSFLTHAPNSVLNMPPHHVSRWPEVTLHHLAVRAGLSVQTIWHEPVAAYHANWYEEVLAYTWFYSRGLLAPRLIDNGLRIKALRALLRSNRIRQFLARRAALTYRFAGRGHTTVLVARKGAVPTSSPKQI